MIITRTPFRISFFGGGTDYPVWFEENEGAVLATTINKYCYITLRYLPPFFDYKSRIVYGKLEHVRDHDQISHPAVRAILNYKDVNRGIELHHDGDLPARTGLGSSSTFTVGLLHAIHGLEGRIVNKQQLAEEAIDVEQRVMQENVGCQDQIIASYGGLHRIHFLKEMKFLMEPLTLPGKRLESLQDHLLLFYTGISRFATEIASEQIKTTKEHRKDGELRRMYQMVVEAINILKSGNDIADFGSLLHESWMIKRDLTKKITSPEIDMIYEAAMSAGALGGKLLGAGGGGFMILFARPETHPTIKAKLSHLLHVPFRFESAGSQVIFYEPNHSVN